MTNTKTMRWLLAVTFIMLTAALVSACNLGNNTVAEPVNPQSAPDDQGGPVVVEEVTPDQEVQLPPTNTPPAELLPNEVLGPITIDDVAELRTQEPVTVRVRRGRSVDDTTCSWTLSDTGATQEFGTPTTNDIDANVQEDVYTFTPAASGTYAVNCQGTANTAAGERQVNASSSSFSIEAKG